MPVHNAWVILQQLMRRMGDARRKAASRAVHWVWREFQRAGQVSPGMPAARAFREFGAGSWLGAGAIVLPGARIARNVVVAAGSVVRGEIPDRCVVAGVPARIVRQHTDAGWGPAAGAPVHALAARRDFAG